jgi:hypothetical protein
MTSRARRIVELNIERYRELLKSETDLSKLRIEAVSLGPNTKLVNQTRHANASDRRKLVSPFSNRLIRPASGGTGRSAYESHLSRSR